MTILQAIRAKANEARIAEDNLEKALQLLTGRLCRRLGIDPRTNTVAGFLGRAEHADNLRAVRAWLDTLQQDWCDEPEFQDEIELADQLDADIRRTMPQHLLGE